MEDIEKLHAAKRRAEEISTELQSASKSWVEEVKRSETAAEAEHQKRMTEAREKGTAQMNQMIDHAGQVDFPAGRIANRLKMWGNLPKEFRSEVSGQIAGLVKKARLGDPVSQEILSAANERLLQGKVDMASLPSLEWQIKKQPPKS